MDLPAAGGSASAAVAAGNHAGGVMCCNKLRQMGCAGMAWDGYPSGGTVAVAACSMIRTGPYRADTCTTAHSTQAAAGEESTQIGIVKWRLTQLWFGLIWFGLKEECKRHASKVY